ncbi:4Fe-4S binding protein [Roseibium salinum]|uniref:4Fe-4S binding protein n=1 Tax=Roseibium salinum TaxID=1604349 RepID=A0ABT3R916_9HYPH|nr:4Fe-4S binding protein [Roseibium sp. DSM 29163]MCX2725540.1 4Fe-4S binding protein [Roseibium sp. DSM 29163]
MTETRLLLCDCRKSQAIDAEQIERATGIPCSRVHTELCRSEVEVAGEAIRSGNVIIACQQERQTFEDLAAELEAEEPGFADIRDRAGWSDDTRPAAAKMAALIADAVLPRPGPRVMDVTSGGGCLILGEAEAALSAAEHLCDALSVTVLLDPQADVPLSHDGRFDIVRGRVKSATGALGQFKLSFAALQERIPGGRGAFNWTDPRDDGRTECDLILDLSREAPLFPAHGKREGYLRADPGNAEARTKALLEASQLIGTFEKPIYVKLDQQLCAHSRAQKTGCRRCLDLCPTGAISPDGDHVSVDTMVCAGCGTCSAVCPSGAISYDAPSVATLFKRIQTLGSTWRKLSADTPRLLVHDSKHGAEIIRLSARYGKGLPADVIPLETSAIASFGHAEALGALACGFGSVTLLLSPETEKDGIPFQTELANAIAGDARVILLEPVDPDQLEEALYHAAPAPLVDHPILPLGSRRQITRLAAKAMNTEETAIALGAGSPYGAVVLDQDACTLCLSCVSLCPSGALKENPDQPQLRFQEDACLQCGICTTICPENALTLDPRLNLGDDALAPIVLKEEEPFSCIECGKPFGVRSTVERLTGKLAGKHSMFQNEKAVRLIQMCDDCRVNAVYHSENNPFAMGERPRVRTSDDYISKRRDH